MIEDREFLMEELDKFVLAEKAIDAISPIGSCILTVEDYIAINNILDRTRARLMERINKSK